MKDGTREKLIVSAMRLFHEQGYAATGVSTILREAGVNSGSMYHFFPNKEALLAAVLDHYAELLWPVVFQPAVSAEEDPVERVFVLLDQYRHGLEMTQCRLGCPIGNLALEVSDSYPGVRERIDLNFRNWVQGVQTWLEQGRERFPKHTDYEALALMVLVCMEGGMMLARARDDLAPYDTAVQQLRRYFTLLMSDTTLNSQ